MTPRELDERLQRFVVAVFAMSRPLIADLATRDLALQLRRAAAGASTNYGAACIARSHRDFTAKIGVTLEEADESHRWLRLLSATTSAHNETVERLSREAWELRQILLAPHRTAKRNQ